MLAYIMDEMAVNINATELIPQTKAMDHGPQGVIIQSKILLILIRYLVEHVPQSAAKHFKQYILKSQCSGEVRNWKTKEWSLP